MTISSVGRFPLNEVTEGDCRKLIADLPDRVVWLPTGSAGCAVRSGLGAGHGTLVTVRSAE